MPRRKRKKEAHPQASSTQIHDTSSNTHFRLCHFCYFLNESVNEIVKCQSCGRTLADRPLGDPLEMNEGDQAWADPQKGFLRHDELGDGSDDTRDDSEEIETDDPEMFARRRMPRLAGLSVVW